MNILCIAIGGSLGAVARYLVSVFVNLRTAHAGIPLPYGTLFVNATGSFAIGFLFALFDRANLPGELRLFLITGFLGGYTTFSSYSLETVSLALEGKALLAASNFALTNGVCLVGTLAGMKASRALFG